ncbi:MAG: DNA polymerase I, partial [Candidatus Marinimicrobia bacterium]|nr:DNA polymerase I [Candidatus Neomarinimicrobiota bacterium]
MAIAYRAHFAMIRNPLITSTGKHVSATYGFMTSILKIINDEKPNYFAVVFDSKEKTFRHKMYADYKATREKMPDEMRPQIGWIKDIIKAMNIPILEQPGFEADDIIGTLAREGEKENLDVFIVSGDKDFMQLINENIFLYSPATGKKELKIYDKKAVEEKWKIKPNQIIDLLALMGDASDNVPGVPGIGEKSAVKLLNKYGDFKTIFENAEKQTNARIRNGLLENKQLAELSKKLVIIDTNVEIDVAWENVKFSEYDNENLIEILRTMEFYSLIDKLNLENNIEEKKETIQQKQNYQTIDTNEKLDEFIKNLNKQKLFSFDTETDNKNPHLAHIVGMSFSWKEWGAFYIPLDFFNKENELFADDDIQFVFEKLKPILENSTIKKVGQNIKYDAIVLSNYDVELNGIEFDTMVAEYLLHPDIYSYKLDNLSDKYLNYKMQPIENLIGEKRGQQITMEKVQLEKISFYACEDADITFQLYNVLRKKIDEENLNKILTDIEIPLIDVLIQMEKNGVFVDVDFLNQMSISLTTDLAKIQKDIYELADEHFNIKSPKQLSYILFEKLKLPIIKKTKTGYSTNEFVLEKLKDKHELPKLILEHRKLIKLKSTYVDALPKLKNPITNRIHTSFNQTVAITGRLSSTNPNFQNIPIRTKVGREIRKSFIAEKPDWKILSADYSQVELRIMAHMSKDKNLVEAFQNDIDVHSSTASLVYGVDLKDVSDDMRRTAKIVNFGIMYGAGAYRISNELKISIPDAQWIIDNYFEKFSGVKEYIEKTIEETKQSKFVATLFGRKRQIIDIDSKNHRLQEASKRVAINMPIQGTAADIIKIAMIKINDEFLKKNIKSKMVSQIHDELV